jgi:hypothetical protein
MSDFEKHLSKVLKETWEHFICTIFQKILNSILISLTISAHFLSQSSLTFYLKLYDSRTTSEKYVKFIFKKM